MITVVYESDQVSVPPWVVDLPSFLRWCDETITPKHWRICWLTGELWMDLSEEQVFTHALVKQEIGFVLTGLINADQSGTFFPDGVLLCNFSADFSSVPDGLFMTHETMNSDRIRFIHGRDNGVVELQGSPDMVLEVVSLSSVQKDTVQLRDIYWKAGIREYWLVDARTQPLRFDILRRTSKGYSVTRKTGGWVKSAVFGKAFQLTQTTNALGHPEFSLQVR